uniref:Uncharacterized protein n=1 Tax=Oryza rufipogon TaxID=4529 RepID=A0A0E0MRQ1_ORYRU
MGMAQEVCASRLLSFLSTRPQLSKELIGLQDKDLEFRKSMHPTREMTSNLIVLNVKYYQDTRLNASNLGEDTTESLTKPSTTDNLLFERSRFDKYGSLQNEGEQSVMSKTGPRRTILSKFPMPMEEARLKNFTLGEDTAESLTNPSTTDNLLFERSSEVALE